MAYWGGKATMNYDVIVTCAVTGAGDTRDKNQHVPVTPREIADSAIASAKAGVVCEGNFIVLSELGYVIVIDHYKAGKVFSFITYDYRIRDKH